MRLTMSSGTLRRPASVSRFRILDLDDVVVLADFLLAFLDAQEHAGDRRWARRSGPARRGPGRAIWPSVGLSVRSIGKVLSVLVIGSCEP